MVLLHLWELAGHCEGREGLEDNLRGVPKGAYLHLGRHADLGAHLG